MKPTYAELLTDPQWQRRRLEILQDRNFACEQCKTQDQTLHVHHRYYCSHRFPWEYPDFCLQVLCVDCHNEVKERIDDIHNGAPAVIIEPWEVGLNFFGNKIFDMAVNSISE